MVLVSQPSTQSQPLLVVSRPTTPASHGYVVQQADSRQGVVMVSRPTTPVSHGYVVQDPSRQGVVMVSRPGSPVNQGLMIVNQDDGLRPISRPVTPTMVTPVVGPGVVSQAGTMVATPGPARMVAAQPGTAIRVPVGAQPEPRYTQLPSGEIVKLVPVQVKILLYDKPL